MDAAHGDMQGGGISVRGESEREGKGGEEKKGTRRKEKGVEEKEGPRRKGKGVEARRKGVEKVGMWRQSYREGGGEQTTLRI